MTTAFENYGQSRYEELLRLADERALDAAEQAELDNLTELAQLTARTDAFREALGYKAAPVQGEPAQPHNTERAEADDRPQAHAETPNPTVTRADLGEVPDPRASVVAVKWEDVEIRFLSDERIQIMTPSGTETLNYAEFGLEDRRTGLPRKAWHRLKDLAQSKGHLAVPIERRAEVEKRIQELRKVLCSKFGVQDDPILCIDNGTAYQAQFIISPAKSFDH